LTAIELISNVAVPFVLWLLMFVVGMELTTADFRRVMVYPRAVTVATLGQLLLLPLVTGLLVWVLDPRPDIAAGMLLVAFCPSGSLSNVYTYLARANVALSVTLTAVSSLLALGSMPLLTAIGFALFLDQHDTIDVPLARMILQLVLLLLFPVALGMSLRHWRMEFVERHGRVLRRLSICALTALVVSIIYNQRELLGEDLMEVAGAALLFSLCAVTVAWTIGLLAGLTGEDRFTLMLEFSVRNLAITAVIGITVLGRVEILLFAAIFLLVQLLLAVLMTLIYRGFIARPVAAA
jgi:BASS family bile acid:Na+ symporter